jgi:hypothetical protein
MGFLNSHHRGLRDVREVAAENTGEGAGGGGGGKLGERSFARMVAYFRMLLHYQHWSHGQ